jgi:L-threonylcarbamoyladenylate synthase
MLGEILGDLVLGLAEEVIHAIVTPDKEKRAAKKAGAKKAGKIIKNGGIVAFPTETVYGLGADAFNSEAVSRVYMAKGRPNDNPLILHIANEKIFYELADTPPDYAKKLIKAYWPGPLTLVVKKKPELPIWLGSHPQNQTHTIGIRMPQNSIARYVIEYSGKVVAAPSANKAGKPSPTKANHIDFAENEIDMIVDGGATKVGIESTVVDVTGETPRILRPGAITAEMIFETTGIEPITSGQASAENVCGGLGAEQGAPLSPGMKYRHYAPNAPMTIISGTQQAVAEYMVKESLRKVSEGKKIGLLVTNSTRELIRADLGQKSVKIITFGDDEKIIARNLFACLRQFDKLDVSEIYAEAVPNTGLGEAIMNRMQKAAEGRVVIVEA